MSADINIEIVSKIFFFIFPDIKIWFLEKELIRKSYMIAKTLLTNEKIEFIDNENFAKTVLDRNFKSFVINLLALEIFKRTTYTSRVT